MEVYIVHITMLYSNDPFVLVVILFYKCMNVCSPCQNVTINKLVNFRLVFLAILMSIVYEYTCISIVCFLLHNVYCIFM